MNNIPTSTQWTLDATGEVGRSAVNSVYMIKCSATGSKGSGFLIENGLIVTNEHVITGCDANQIFAISAYGQKIPISQKWVDPNRDLALLRPAIKQTGGLSIVEDNDLKVGESVTTWGYPLGYNGPAPLLSVGYLAGFNSYQTHKGQKKHLVVNGAFNSGNSGGALLKASDNKVIGIVVNKHAPISNYHQLAIEALAKNKSGVVFTATNETGKAQDFVESQIVAELLIHMRSLTQVMIGEAIAAEELLSMLREIDLSPPQSISRNALCYCGSGKRFKECHGKVF
ncbi:trypsin-like peptidase domain-containing protein [Klebsiella aerogenes]|uniref:trypsin-like peptidase domain-containing protein n=1 Tax=Klebsiella aerogenes TaxID=548 RepID=UPI000941A4E1|nr:trypsin-like peptidase domain-containing protein [Klebsiella aerogenes]